MEADIAPFRALLLGMFFMTVGFEIDLALCFNNLPLVASLVSSLGHFSWEDVFPRVHSIFISTCRFCCSCCSRFWLYDNIVRSLAVYYMTALWLLVMPRRSQKTTIARVPWGGRA